MEMKEYIIFGAGEKGKECLHYYGKKNVRFFCDNFFPRIRSVEGIDVIDYFTLKEVHKKYEVIVASGLLRSRVAICNQLKEDDIPYIVFSSSVKNGVLDDMLHVYGNVDNLLFDWNPDEVKENRYVPTEKLLKRVFKEYRKDYIDKTIDAYFYLNDNLTTAYRCMQYLGIKKIFAYSTLDILKDTIVAFPDYRFCYDENEYYYDETPEKLRAVSEKKWEDKRIYFRGTEYTSEGRTWLKILQNRYPDVICAEVYNGWRPKNQVVSMLEYAKYKYSIDIRGFGWTDRTKILLQLGRPLFLVDRPYKEWYYEKMSPMVHYIPIKEDLSDLCEKYWFMEDHPELYTKMVMEMRDFVDNNFKPSQILQTANNIILDNGILE